MTINYMGLYIIPANTVICIYGAKIIMQDITNYPIALFKNNDGIPHIIYGAAWNHVQIMNLDYKADIDCRQIADQRGRRGTAH